VSAASLLSEIEEAWRRHWDREDRRRKRMVVRDRLPGGGYELTAYAFDLELSPGGCFETGGKLSGWMSMADFDAARARYLARCSETGVREPSAPNYVLHQCGGCFWHGATGLDWGLCLNPASPHDGRIVFEHGGCEAHSDLAPREVRG
jgi:hypothetical protein